MESSEALTAQPQTLSLPTANMCSRTAPCVRSRFVNTSSGNSWMAEMRICVRGNIHDFHALIHKITATIYEETE